MNSRAKTKSDWLSARPPTIREDDGRTENVHCTVCEAAPHAIDRRWINGLSIAQPNSASTAQRAPFGVLLPGDGDLTW
jgi:hypothetical protein